MKHIYRARAMYDAFLHAITRVDFLAPLALRLYLAPVFWMAGTQKLSDIESTAAWFGNPEWGLGLPMPVLMAWLAGLAEAGGAIFLVLGFGVRLTTIPLMITMAVATFTVHWQNGWLAIAEGANSLFSTERTIAATERLDRVRNILQEHGNYDWLTEHGRVVMLNNGVEFAVTYWVMLMALLFLGAGRWCSVDHALDVFSARATKSRAV